VPAGYLILAITLSVLAASCDSGAVPTAPSAPVSTPALPAPNRPLGRDWTGTFVSSNWEFSPFPILARLERTGDTIKGNWLEVLWLDFGGTIEGTIDGTAFVGTVTIEDCKVPVRGTFTDTTASWTSPAVNDRCSVYGLASPVDISFNLSR